MSPRSQEFLDSAREELAAAADLIATEHPVRAISAAYYAMLYAARAALSERDLYAKTHQGIWALFSEQFVKVGRFDARLRARADRARELREAGDYEAAGHDLALAEAILRDAERFVAAAAGLFAD